MSLLDSDNLDLASTPGVPPPAPAPPPSAIPTAQRARIINGQHTDVLVQIFADRILVVVTQMGKIGCMIQISPPPPTLPSPVPQPPSNDSRLATLPLPHPSTVLTPLFGVPPTPRIASLHDLYASQVGAIVFHALGGPGSGGDPYAEPTTEGDSKPVVLGIGLKLRAGEMSDDDEGGGISEDERKTFAEVMEMVQDCLGL